MSVILTAMSAGIQSGSSDISSAEQFLNLICLKFKHNVFKNVKMLFFVKSVRGDWGIFEFTQNLCRIIMR